MFDFSAIVCDLLLLQNVSSPRQYLCHGYWLITADTMPMRVTLNCVAALIDSKWN